MSYQSLYREWRPRTFSEVSGQEHIKQTLTNMLAHQRVPHALLFCGPRGTGKTTMAKIFAKAVNCKEGISPKPCLKCNSCEGIASNNSIDVFEIDAASNRGIDEIRQLREQVKYTPTESRYKVYIIDEVHMLTTEAFNALLKTLEEPPAHVLFVLATTEPHKLPLTIISRCQRFDFRRLDPRAIRARLLEVSQAKGVTISSAAASHIAQLAEGGMRDALGMLEQSMAYGDDEVTLETVEQVTGSVPLDVFLKLLRLMEAGDEAAALVALAEELDAGREANQLLSSYLSALRKMLLAAHSSQLLVSAGFEAEEVERISSTANVLRPVLPTLIEMALSTEGEMKYGGHPRLHLELLLVRQMVALRGQVDMPRPVPRPAISPVERQTAMQGGEPAPTVERRRPNPPPTESNTASPQISKLLKAWPEVLQVIRVKAPLTASTLSVVSPVRLEGDMVILQMTESNTHTYKRLMDDMESIRSGLSTVLGRKVQVKLEMNGTEPVTVMPGIDQVKEALDLFKAKIIKDK